jgi:hypothetical protein
LRRTEKERERDGQHDQPLQLIDHGRLQFGPQLIVGGYGKYFAKYGCGRERGRFRSDVSAKLSRLADVAFDLLDLNRCDPGKRMERDPNESGSAASSLRD